MKRRNRDRWYLTKWDFKHLRFIMLWCAVLLLRQEVNSAAKGSWLWIIDMVILFTFSVELLWAAVTDLIGEVWRTWRKEDTKQRD